jgi:type II secretory pathway component PulF
MKKFVLFYLDFPWKIRAAFYKHVLLLQRHNVVLTECCQRFIERLEREKSTKAATLIREGLVRMHNGMDFSQAFGVIVPNQEAVMLAVGVQSQDLPKALERLLENHARQALISKSIMSEISPVVANLGLALSMLLVVANQVVPALQGILPPENIHGLLAMLFFLGAMVVSPWFVLGAALFALALILIFVSLPRWCGPGRLFAERFPIYSQYRDLNGIIWLGNFSALVAARSREVTALRSTYNHASPWLKERIELFVRHMDDGKTLPQAMLSAKIDGIPIEFPDREIVGDVDAIHGHPGSAEALTHLVEQSGQQVIQRVLRSVSWFGTGATILTVGLMMLITMSTFEMQQAVSDSLQGNSAGIGK